MRFFAVIFSLFLVSCGFTPLYSSTQDDSVCVAPISEYQGFVLSQELKSRFTGQSSCKYTLQVDKPSFVLSDLGISNNSFSTIKRVQAKANYSLLDSKHKKILTSSALAEGSFSIVNNPYASVTAQEKTEEDLLKTLAHNIEIHISTFLSQDKS